MSLYRPTFTGKEEINPLLDKNNEDMRSYTNSSLNQDCKHSSYKATTFWAYPAQKIGECAISNTWDIASPLKIVQNDTQGFSVNIASSNVDIKLAVVKIEKLICVCAFWDG